MYDRLFAKALEMSEARLIRLGWKYTNEDIGRNAARMVNAFKAELNDSDDPDDPDNTDESEGQYDA